MVCSINLSANKSKSWRKKSQNVKVYDKVYEYKQYSLFLFQRLPIAWLHRAHSVSVESVEFSGSIEVCWKISLHHSEIDTHIYCYPYKMYRRGLLRFIFFKLPLYFGKLPIEWDIISIGIFSDSNREVLFCGCVNVYVCVVHTCDGGNGTLKVINKACSVRIWKMTWLEMTTKRAMMVMMMVNAQINMRTSTFNEFFCHQNRPSSHFIVYEVSISLHHFPHSNNFSQTNTHTLYAVHRVDVVPIHIR